jgi:hypothetical protein
VPTASPAGVSAIGNVPDVGGSGGSGMVVLLLVESLYATGVSSGEIVNPRDRM